MIPNAKNSTMEIYKWASNVLLLKWASNVLLNLKQSLISNLLKHFT